MVSVFGGLAFRIRAVLKRQTSLQSAPQLFIMGRLWYDTQRTAHRHSLSFSLSHSHTHTHTHARTHARAHTHTHTHTHTHKLSGGDLLWKWSVSMNRALSISAALCSLYIPGRARNCVSHPPGVAHDISVLCVTTGEEMPLLWCTSTQMQRQRLHRHMLRHLPLGNSAIKES